MKYLNSISILIADKPEIEQEETFIHTGEGDQTEVICIVHSSPKATVTWFKDGEELTQESHDFLINTHGNRHTLTIPGVDSTKFGKYACRAENGLGEDQKTTEVSGKKHAYLLIQLDSPSKFEQNVKENHSSGARLLSNFLLNLSLWDFVKKQGVDSSNFGKHIC